MPSKFPRPELSGGRSTGIIRALPYNPGSSDRGLRAAYKDLLKCLRALNTDDSAEFYVGMAQKPVQDVLHIYLLAGGRIVGRANIAGYLTDQPPMIRLDNTVQRYKYWCILSAPFTEPPEKLLRRGFRGFRYCGDLW